MIKKTIRFLINNFYLIMALNFFVYAIFNIITRQYGEAVTSILIAGLSFQVHWYEVETVTKLLGCSGCRENAKNVHMVNDDE